MAFKRHKHHDKIVEALIANKLPTKTIAHQYQTTVSSVKAIKARWIVENREKKFDPGEGQLHFWNWWK